MRIATSDECCRHFLNLRGLDGDGDPDLIGLFAYALVERDRLEWIDHCGREGMPDPGTGDIQTWFSQKPPSYFDDKLRQAVSRFDLYARGYMADEVEVSKKQAVEHAITGLRGDLGSTETKLLSAVYSASDNSGHWLRGIAQGVFGNATFALLLIILIIIATKDPSAVAWLRDLLR